MRIVWSELALDDLDQIIFHVAEENVSAALRMDADIIRHTDLLRGFPLMGRPGRIFGTRELVVSWTRCVVAYRIDEETVIVLRVRHGAQQWPNAL